MLSNKQSEHRESNEKRCNANAIDYPDTRTQHNGECYSQRNSENYEDGNK